VEAFHDRAPTYENDWRGKMHLDIVARTVDVALAVDTAPRRVLDVGCGTGALLRLLADRLAGDEQELVGIDAASGMIDAAHQLVADDRLVFSTGVAEHLPYPDEHFDLVVSTTSFDHWQDQRAGLRECARVLGPGGHLVLTDVFSLWLTPTLMLGRRDHARTRGRATTVLRAAGFRTITWQRLYQLVISTAVAAK
jgi:ubiquinone/menaquinone biosynthesis C-methylase UbiE